jgi:type IV secretion system protein VirD4
MVSGATFTLDELLEGRADLYLIVPLDILNDMNGFFRLFMYLALGAATRAGLARKSQPQLMMIFDEFTRLGRMNKVLDIATVAAGLNVDGIFVVQDLGAFKESYGDNGARTIISASATTRIFALGRGDDITANWLESLMPQKTIITRSASEGDQIGNRGEVPAPLISATEILELPPDQMICLIRSHAPLKLAQIVAYEHPTYRSRMNLPFRPDSQG